MTPLLRPDFARAPGGFGGPPVAAIATSTATDAALSVLRMSGTGSWELLAKCLRKKGGPPDPAGIVPRQVFLFEFVDPATAEPLDVVTVIFYRPPNSYTGEDSAELICHGGRAITRRILDRLVSAGFSAAPPGEFTRRAFLNGKMDLAQAEAVAASTSASSEIAARAAAKGLIGETSVRIREFSDGLVDLLSLLEANLDLSEEGIDVVPPGKIHSVLESTSAFLDELLNHAARSKLLTGSIRVAFVGKPNVGKSTLFNRLLGSDRAIVSDFPGTTRDVVEARVEIDGLLFDFLDTAGIRAADHPVESEGIERSRRAASGADLVLFVLDASSIGAVDLDLSASLPAGTPRVTVLNKTDLSDISPEAMTPFLLNGFRKAPVVRTVGISRHGVDELRATLAREGRKLFEGMADAPVWISARQAETLGRAKSAVNRAIEAAGGAGLTEEFLSADIREAVLALEEFTGRKTADDVLNKIFSEFCVGK